MQCWAECLGDCQGPQSSEHYFSRSLYSGPVITVKGFPWCKEPREIPIEAAKSNILCKRHNELLSLLDEEAARAVSAFVRCGKRPRIGKDGRLRRAPERIVLSGTRFTRWLTKTYCNMAAMDKRAIPPELVEYSFGRSPVTDLFFYAHIFKGQRLNFDEKHIQFADGYDDFGHVLWYVLLGGILWFGSTLDLAELDGVFSIGNEIVRPADLYRGPPSLSIKHTIPGHGVVTMCTIEFNWGDRE